MKGTDICYPCSLFPLRDTQGSSTISYDFILVCVGPDGSRIRIAWPFP